MNIIFDDNINSPRIDTYLAECLPDLTRSRVQALIKDGHIQVNDAPVKCSYKLTRRDEIGVDIPEPTETGILPRDIDLNIIYEDPYLVVIDKPKGMVVHPAAGHSDDTMVNALMYRLRGHLSGIGGELRPGIVHRIDKDTTGLVIACKDDVTHKRIADELARHNIIRIYTALCFGNFTEDEGIVDAPIGRSKKNRKLMTAVDPAAPRAALTHYEVTERFAKGPDRLCLVKCRLETGRTHQIRVHMSYIKHPLAGDELYGRRNDPLKGHGQYLHAGTLIFKHPITGEELKLEAPLPLYFTETLDKLRMSAQRP